MNVAEYFLPIMQLEKPINELRSKFAVTINKFLKDEEKIMEVPEEGDNSVPTNGDKASPRNIAVIPSPVNDIG